MRLTTSGTLVTLALLAGVARADTSANTAAGAPPGDPGAPGSNGPGNGVAVPSDKQQDLLGNMVVVAAATRTLPKIGVVPSLSADLEDVTLRSVVRRDLDLCGEVEVLSEDAAPDGLYLADSPIDTKAWGQKGAEAVVRVSARKVGDRIELVGQAYLVKKGATPVFERTLTALPADLRTASHRLADSLIGALSGTNGGFASRMTFASGTGNLRRIYAIDADGNGARAVSGESETPVGPAFGKGEELYYAASRDHGEYRIRTESGADKPLPLKGSVYGLAFSKDRTKVAVSIGAGSAIKLFLGEDFDHLAPASTAAYAMEPTFTPTGKLAYVAPGTAGQRIFIEDKPVTPDGVFAQSPTFCNHPEGTRLVFAAGASLDTDLFSTSDQGGSVVRLTQDQGKNSSPACSPDGRMIAFFSTRKSNEGPGLYIMRADGLRPKRISSLLGDSLRWDPLPPEKPEPIPSSPPR